MHWIYVINLLPAKCGNTCQEHATGNTFVPLARIGTSVKDLWCPETKSKARNNNCVASLIRLQYFPVETLTAAMHAASTNIYSRLGAVDGGPARNR